MEHIAKIGTAFAILLLVYIVLPKLFSRLNSGIIWLFERYVVPEQQETPEESSSESEPKHSTSTTDRSKILREQMAELRRRL